MSDPIYFTSASARYDLPFLFSGQSQKEVFVNEAYGLIDGLLHPVVQGLATSPPADPANGESWLVAEDAAGPWAGKAGSIAIFQAGNWLFANPQPGMGVFDYGLGQCRYWRNGWQVAPSVSAPEGGSLEDAEARSAIAHLIQALTTAGILPA